MARSDVDQEELRLLQAVANGDADAGQTLYERHRDYVYRVALRVTGRHEDAMDVVQDSFIKAFRSVDNFARQSRFRTWIARIAANRSLDLLRKRKVRLAVPIDGGDDRKVEIPDRDASGAFAGRVEKNLEQNELLARLQDAIETLPADQRSVFSLYASGEMTYGEIAEALGIPIGTVMSRLYHARRKLRAALPDLAAALTTENES